MELQDMTATYKQVPEDLIGVKLETLPSEQQENHHLSSKETQTHDQRSRRWTQHLAALLATLGSMSVGIVDAWTANAVPAMNNKNISLNANLTNLTGEDTGGGFTDAESSWLGSLVPIGALAGSPPAGVMADAVGRKVVLLFMSIPFLVGWIIIAVAGTSIPLLYVSRFISGFCMGVVSVVTPLYNEEISEVSVRGALGVYHNLMLTIGILISYIVGAYFSYTWQAVIPCIVPVTMLVTYIWAPESPVYLLAKGKVKKAEKALRWLRGPKYDINPELESLQSMVIEAKSRNDNETSLQAIRRILTNISAPTNKAIGIVFALMILRQLSGINAIVFYTVDIFDDANSSLSSTSDAMIIGAVEVVSTYCASLLVDKIGRRVLLLFSAVGAAICHGTLSVYFILLGQEYDVSSFAWIPLVMLGIFIIIFAAGFGPIPWFMMAELIPKEEKKWAAGMAVFISWIFMFIVIKLFTGMKSTFGEAPTFGIFCLNCVIAALFVGFCVPETSGKTLEEIQKELRGETQTQTQTGL